MSKYVKKVFGVEINKSAIKDANINAKRNSISNIEFICSDAGKYMQKLAEKKEKIDVVVMDPPRAGADDKFLNSMIKLQPKKVIYISCNPVTLKENMMFLSKKGYEVKSIQPVDMFPFTEHVECIALICRK